MTVDASANMLRLVSAGRQWDADVDGICEGYHRLVEVLQPGGGDRDWIPVSPPDAKRPAPPTWDIRNSYYVDVVMVPNPAPGLWKIRTRYDYWVCRQNEPVPMDTQALESDFLMNISVQSLIRLEGRFLDPYEDNQGLAGDHVPIVAALMQKTGTLPGALVLALVEKPGSGSNLLWLRDDGEHGDGAAGDGIYGFVYPKTTVGGPYNVTIVAAFPDPTNPAQNLVRAWYGSFYVQGDDESQDDDPFPSWWEREYPCMDPDEYNSTQEDYDKDGLINVGEWENGTNPCDPDTDDGGEMDGSEVNGGRDPLYPPDDKVRPILNFSFRPLNGGILIRWSRPLSYTVMLVDYGGRGPIDIGRTGAYTLPLENGKPYTVTLQGSNADGEGAPTSPQMVMPKLDPDPPSGFIQVNGGAPQTFSREVILNVNASDALLDGLPYPGSAASIANAYTKDNLVSADTQMRFTNDTGEGWSPWEPYAPEKPWALDADCAQGTSCVVYAQFKDGAENESLVVYDEILYQPAMIYLPLVLQNQ
ncbi:MAG: choice-of-anchor X domain-containing protein [Chloroflexota bacterium]